MERMIELVCLTRPTIESFVDVFRMSEEKFMQMNDFDSCFPDTIKEIFAASKVFHHKLAPICQKMLEEGYEPDTEEKAILIGLAMAFLRLDEEDHTLILAGIAAARFSAKLFTHTVTEGIWSVTISFYQVGDSIHVATYEVNGSDNLSDSEELDKLLQQRPTTLDQFDEFIVKISNCLKDISGDAKN